VLVYSWPFTPDEGYNRVIVDIKVNKAGTRLYMLRKPAYGTSPYLYVYSLETPLPTQLGGPMVLPTGATWVQVNDAGTALAVYLPGSTKIIEVDVTGDVLTILRSTTSSNFDALSRIGIDSFPIDNLQTIPPPRVPPNLAQRPPPSVKFFYKNTDGNVMYAYTRLDKDPVYTYNLEDLALGNCYRLAFVSPRPSRNTP
jgi:hypothetical protein